METTQRKPKPNIKKLYDRICQEQNPEAAATAFLAFAKPRFEDFVNSQEEVDVRIR